MRQGLPSARVPSAQTLPPKLSSRLVTPRARALSHASCAAKPFPIAPTSNRSAGSAKYTVLVSASRITSSISVCAAAASRALRSGNAACSGSAMPASRASCQRVSTLPKAIFTRPSVKPQTSFPKERSANSSGSTATGCFHALSFTVLRFTTPSCVS